MYKLKFKKSVAKDLKKIGEENSQRIMKKIREKLLLNPELGKPLKGYYGELWSYRVADFRILYTFSVEELFIMVIRIGHRKEVYKKNTS